jgi:hypothetical protein
VDPATGATTRLTPDYGVQLGGLVVQGETLYYLVGNDTQSTFGPAGKLMALNLRTHEIREVLTGLNKVNGMVGLPDGSLAFTVTFGSGAGVWRTNPQNTSARRLTTTPISPDGITRIGDELYVTGFLQGEVWRVDDSTGAADRVANWVPMPDDLTAMPDGNLYQATELGIIWRIDPATGEKSVVTTGLLGATSAKEWDAHTLTVTTISGEVFRLAL